MRRLIGLGLLASAIGLGLLVLLWAMAPPAGAHSWYSAACCSGIDCQPMPANSVEASPAGWRLKETGEVVPYGDKREQDSQDSDFHVCRYGSYAAAAKAGKIRCLYVPGAGM